MTRPCGLRMERGAELPAAALAESGICVDPGAAVFAVDLFVLGEAPPDRPGSGLDPLLGGVRHVGGDALDVIFGLVDHVAGGLDLLAHHLPPHPGAEHHQNGEDGDGAAEDRHDVDQSVEHGMWKHIGTPLSLSSLFPSQYFYPLVGRVNSPAAILAFIAAVVVR